MSDNKTPRPKKSFSPDWLVRGVLAKIGESFDRLTGRDWKPSSSLATSELIERLKKLLDAKVKDLGEKGRFVPHNIKLKMQWDKFSADAEAALQKLQYELHAAAIDHINDNRYHTYAPLRVEIKPDYFTEGVNLMVGFDKFAEEGEGDDAVKVTMPDVNLQNIVIGGIEPEPEPEPETEKFVVEFKIDNRPKTVELEFLPNQRLNVGRTKENDLTIEDASVSKVHASLVLNGENQLMVADTGSTNGTFVNGQRIAYGKAFLINETDKVKFGTVDVFFRRVPRPVDFATRESYASEEFQTQPPAAVRHEANPTVAANQSFQTQSDIYKTNQSHRMNQINEAHPGGNGGAESGREISKDDQSSQTGQRIKLDLGDDNQK
jgi:pSer/pThr/pTyr-binding forkhead associated (FHA) protein